MADKGPGSTGRSKGTKRLARAKIKPTDNGIKSSKGRVSVQVEGTTQTQKQKQEAFKKRAMAIGVGIFAVIMALSMMLPSLSYIFGNSDEQRAAAEAQAQAEAEAEAAEQEAADAEESKDEDGEDSEETSGIAKVDANYKAVVDPLEGKLKDNEKDLATLLNLGNNYMSWAQNASMYATDEDGQQHVSELFTKAMDYFDRYLELNDSPAVKVNRALCQLYGGDLTAAKEALTTLTEEYPDYGPAWANLGMVLEYSGTADEAKEAYQKAVEVDADDEYGAKSYANQRLASMAASENSDLSEETDATAEDTNAGSSSSTPQAGVGALEDALEAGKN